jgi:hypothetical protein
MSVCFLLLLGEMVCVAAVITIQDVVEDRVIEKHWFLIRQFPVFFDHQNSYLLNEPNLSLVV